MLHIAFVTKRTLTLILSGDQTCESRLSVNRHPARGVQVGDWLLFKCGDGRALAKVMRVDVYEDLTPADIVTLQEMYGRVVDGSTPDAAYWLAKCRSRHAVFLFLSEVRSCHVPGSLLPSTQSAWVQDFPLTDEIRVHLRRARRVPTLATQPALWS